MDNPDHNKFYFRDLHPNIFLGTTSDRYAGWVGQIYSKERYVGRIKRRTHVVGGEKFVEEVLPVDSVEEYFKHFRVLEIDYTFYRPLTEPNGSPTQNYHLLSNYRQYIKEGDRLILKVPQMISAQKFHRGKDYIPNEDYLNHEVFTNQFYQPALELLGNSLSGFIFEQEYQKLQDRPSENEMAVSLDTFFGAIPKDQRYHVELRTESYLIPPVFEVLEKYGVGQVLSHWTWLPPLGRQFARAGNKVFNSDRELIIRLVTPIDLRYEAAYAKAYPFDKIIQGMVQPKMIEETAKLMHKGVEMGDKVNVLVNNRTGGNAPLIARMIADRFLHPVPQCPIRPVEKGLGNPNFRMETN